MSTLQSLQQRADNKCELCSATSDLDVYPVPPKSQSTVDDSILACAICRAQLDNPEATDPNHWRCLNDSMWSPNLPVQVVAWRMLTRLRSEGWPQDLLDMMYLEGDDLVWAQATGEGLSEEDKVVHRDSNGAQLTAGDNVVLIKDLNVKGAGFTAKRGTAVRGISLVADNADQIEGRVNGQQIVILCQYVKKS